MPAPVYSVPAVSAPRPQPAKPKPAPTYQAPVTDLSEDERAYLAAQGSEPAPRLKAAEIRAMVQKVQVALVVRGYDPGAVDGKLGQKTKIALGRFQAANGLPISGAMDLETLRRLGVEVAMPSRMAEEPASSEPTGADLIARPDWARKPSDDMARYYPDRAQRMEVSGRATISCTVTEQGTLENCTVVSESPADMGLGDAATLRGVLRVGASSIFSSRVIVPRLADFMTAHPALRVELLVDDRRQDLTADGIDVALRFGKRSFPH